MKSIDDILENRRILITSGTGGVGKTTVAAALAIRAAMRGKNALVITVDPAKRLATSLGVEELGDEPTDLTFALEKAISNKKISDLGSFSAIIPDHKRTLENFFDSLASNPKLAEQIKANPIFEMISREFSGANEYMAIQRLNSIVASDEFDTIILDTPPNRNVLAILNAPKLLSRLFEDKMIGWVMGQTNSILNKGINKVLGALEFLTGAGFVRELFNFGRALFETRVGFTATLDEIHDLFQSEKVGFLLITAPSPDTVGEFEYLASQLKEKRFHFDGVVLNRTLGYFNIKDSDRAAAESKPEIQRALKVVDALQTREKKVAQEISTENIFQLPEFSRDVHSLDDLLLVAESLADPTPQRS